MLITNARVQWSSYNFWFSLFLLHFVFCVSVKVKLTVPLLCVCVHSAWKGGPRNDLYCVGRDVKPYSLTHLANRLQTVLGVVVSSDVRLGIIELQRPMYVSVKVVC